MNQNIVPQKNSTETAFDGKLKDCREERTSCAVDSLASSMIFSMLELKPPKERRPGARPNTDAALPLLLLLLLLAPEPLPPNSSSSSPTIRRPLTSVRTDQRAASSSASRSRSSFERKLASSFRFMNFICETRSEICGFFASADMVTRVKWTLAAGCGKWRIWPGGFGRGASVNKKQQKA